MDPHNHKYRTPEEETCAMKLYPEYQKLFELWKQWDAAESTDAERVPLAVGTLLDGFMAETREGATKNGRIILKKYNEDIRDLLVWVFRFGQWLMTQEKPVRFEDFSHCNCAILTDEDLVKLLESTP